MKLLGLDFETGASFDTPLKDNFITEIGAAIQDTDHGIVDMCSTLIKNDEIISPDCIQYTGITNEAVDEWGRSPGPSFERLFDMWQRSDVIVAHNGLEFDIPLLEAYTARKKLPIFPKKLVIDTMIDIEYPANCKAFNLTHLQAFHGFVYPGHRALFDVMAMLNILSKYDLDVILQSASSPIVEVMAVVNGYRDLAGREAAKANKFRWNPDRKIWTKKMRKHKADNTEWKLPITILA